MPGLAADRLVVVPAGVGAEQPGVDVVESAGEASGVAVERATADPGMPRPPIPGDDPVVEREPERRQALVVRGDRRKPLQGVPEVVAQEPDEAAEERRGVGRDDRGRVQAGDEPARDRERVRAGGRRLEDRDRVGGQVRPAGVAARAGTLEEGQPRQVAERLGGVDGPGGGDPIGQATQADASRAGRAVRPGGSGPMGITRPMIRPTTRGPARAARAPRAATVCRCEHETSGSPWAWATPGPLNAITDVAGVTVGHTTLIEGDGPLVVGQGPVRTGVTVVCPRGPALAPRAGLRRAATASTATAS